MAKYTVAHGSLKVQNSDGSTKYLTAGDEVDLDPKWVAKNDPSGVGFLSAEDWAKTHAAAVARAALSKKHAAESAKLTDEQKAEVAREKLVAEKHLVAIEAAIAAKKFKAAEKVAVPK